MQPTQEDMEREDVVHQSEQKSLLPLNDTEPDHEAQQFNLKVKAPKNSSSISSPENEGISHTSSSSHPSSPDHSEPGARQDIEIAPDQKSYGDTIQDDGLKEDQRENVGQR